MFRFPFTTYILVTIEKGIKNYPNYLLLGSSFFNRTNVLRKLVLFALYLLLIYQQLTCWNDITFLRKRIWGCLYRKRMGYSQSVFYKNLRAGWAKGNKNYRKLLNISVRLIQKPKLFIILYDNSRSKQRFGWKSS